MSYLRIVRSKPLWLPLVSSIAGVWLLASCGHGGSTFIPGSDASAGAGGVVGSGGAAGAASAGGSSGGAGNAGSGAAGGSDGSGGAGGSDGGGAGVAGSGGSAGVAGSAGASGNGGAGGSGGSAGTSGSASNGGSAGEPQGPVTKIFGEVPGADHSSVTIDTKIRGDTASTQTYDYGGGWFFGPDANPITHALIRFNTSAIPTNAVVLSGVLELWTGACANCQGNPSTSVDVYQLMESWTEGSFDSEVTATAGFCNWNYRSSGTPWSAPGAEPPSRSAAAAATFYPLALDTKYAISLSTTVQAWVDTPSSNYGILLKMVDPAITDGVAFVSSESAENAGSPAKRPRLVVQYVLP